MSTLSSLSGGETEPHITPPPGYHRLELLHRQRHAGLGLVAAPGYAWARALPAVVLGATEIARAALDYPVAFARDPQEGEFVPMALLGLRPQQNLFVSPDGRWQPGCYIPAYLRRYPFCVAQRPARNGHSTEGMICVEAGSLGHCALPLFNPDGQPTEAFTPWKRLIDSLETARLQARVLGKRLESLDLLVPFDAVARPRGQPPLQLKGLHRVEESRLQDLRAADLRTLLKRGELKVVHAHLLSLENFPRLLDLQPSP